MNHILVVDDEEYMRETIAQILTFEGYAIQKADDGIEALQLLTTFTPDLIVCDVNMPKLDGFGLLKELRKRESTSGIPFIFLTGQTDRPSQREGMSTGADDYITKPFETDELIKAVELRLGRYRQIRDKIEKRLDELRNSMKLTLPHEFRTPLTGILGFAELLEQTQGLSAEETAYIGSHIRKSASRLHRLVERMLLHAELDSNLSDPERIKSLRDSSVEVGPTVRQVIDAQASEAQRAGDVRASLLETRVRVLEAHLSRAVEEVVNNAFKFSNQGLEVAVIVTQEADSVAISVRDHGVGMSQEQIQSIGAFVQFDRERREQQGPGLGLALVKKLCDLYEGSLVVESASPGGTNVTLRFPIAR